MNAIPCKVGGARWGGGASTDQPQPAPPPPYRGVGGWWGRHYRLLGFGPHLSLPDLTECRRPQQ